MLHIIPTLSSYFLPFCYPFALLHFCGLQLRVGVFSNRHMFELRYAIYHRAAEVYFSWY